MLCMSLAMAEDSLEKMKRDFHAAKYPKNQLILTELRRSKYNGKETVSFLTSLLTRKYTSAKE